jgi:hypothetical protein
MEDLGRKPVLAKWTLLGELWCLPLDQTEDEQQAFFELLRENQGSDFAACPTKYIADRLYGGFKCYEYPDRHHVIFDTGAYGYLAAAEHSYWPNDGRGEKWDELLKGYPAADLIASAPFTEGRPPLL